jgi:hypothetical protein
VTDNLPGRQVNDSRGHPDAETIGWLRGSSEALAILRDREDSSRQRALLYAVRLLEQWAGDCNWQMAGFPPSGSSAAQSERQFPLSHDAILQLAYVAMRLHTGGRPPASRAACWHKLAEFVGSYVTPENPILGRMREQALIARVDGGDVSGDIVAGLESALERHLAEDGIDAYMTGIARTNLVGARRRRSLGSDLSDATELAASEAARRAACYGLDHPATLVARSEYVQSLIVQADASPSLTTRRQLARRAFDEANLVRIARDRLYGITSENSTRSRRHIGHALLLLGDLERARICLECALAFEVARTGIDPRLNRGRILLLLARVHDAAGDATAAAELAGQAARILGKHSPESTDYRRTVEIVRKYAHFATPDPAGPTA